MTEPEQRIAIAEACDHYFTQALDEPHAWGFREAAKTTVYPWRDSKEEAALMDAPDYLHDLNAMHEAVETLPLDQRKTWPIKLRQIVARDNAGSRIDGRLDDTYFYDATAPQRAEAFLRTVGKWKDTP